VLVLGPTGTGKEVAARALHQLSQRARRPFVPVACGAIPGELAESELLGHERGAFTGASGRRIGAFERADRGTLLLDDVDDMPLGVQAKLLRVLQDGRFTRVGGTEEVQVDVRVVATTKVDLTEAIKERRFRDDLFYRLQGLEIVLPPLRARGDDILLLAQHFLDRRAPGNAGITADTAELLTRYAWPGNVRELLRAMESAGLICGGEAIRPEHLPRQIGAYLERTPGAPYTLHVEHRDSLPFVETVHGFEQALLHWALDRSGGQQKRAAEMLGLPRTTFQSKLIRDD